MPSVLIGIAAMKGSTGLLVLCSSIGIYFLSKFKEQVGRATLIVFRREPRAV